MSTLTYSQQLRHPMWQRRRLQRLDSSGWMCQRCLCTDSTLHVHHKLYIKGRMAWEYGDEHLTVLCEDCHETVHALDEHLKLVVAQFFNKEALIAHLTGFLFGSGEMSGTHPLAKDVDQNDVSYQSGVTAAAFQLMTIDQAVKAKALAASVLDPRDLDLSMWIGQAGQ